MNKLIILLLLSFSCSILQAQTNIFPSTGAAGIGTVAPNSSALLDVTSTSKGILVPRMTFTQRNAISTPAIGLLIYQTNKTPGFYYYNGNAWTTMSSSNGVNTTLSNLASPTAINQSLIPGVSNSIDIGSSTNLWKKAYFSGDALINGLTVGLGGGINSSNSAVGNGALKSNTTGIYNTAVGQGAMNHNDSGSYNTATGSGALFNNNCVGSTACGYNALYSNTYGAFNTAVGFEALEFNTNGAVNTAIGFEALVDNNGYNNVAVGYLTLGGNSLGMENVAIGNYALSYNASGNDNTATGYYALAHSTSPSYCTANGAFALAQSTGSSSSAFGYNSLLNNTSGTNNTGCGYGALGTCVTGSNNTSIGSLADVTQDDLNNATAIGSNAVVSLSNCVVLGSSAVTKLGIGVTPSSSNIVQFQTTTAKLTTGGVWTNASDRKLKNNFEKLDKKNILEKVNALDIERWHYIADKDLVTHIGPVAQDFYTAFGVGDDTTISTVDPSGVALLAIQALSKENDSLKLANQNLQLELNGVLSRLDLIEQAMSQCCSSFQSAVDNKSGNSSILLDQNEPNPFIQSTIIHYYIPATATNASILVSDLSGNIILRFNSLKTGAGDLLVKASDLLSGAYQYSLIIDGKAYDSKQMILQK